MKRVVHTNLSLGFGVIVLLMRLAIPAGGQEYLTVSIDCGSEENYTDGATGIKWVTDEGYIETGQNVGGITVPTNDTSIVNGKQMETLRFFPEERLRHCYVIPVTPMRTYLVRGTFFYGNWTPPVQKSTFTVYVNATAFGTGVTKRKETRVFESIFYSAGGQINFCLKTRKGTPFISSLEVRMMGTNMYSIVPGNTILLCTWRRYSAVANQSSLPPVRYPDDEFDRMWTFPPRMSEFPDNPCTDVLRTNKNVSLSSITQERPPNKVMQNAWICTKSRTMYFESEDLELPVGHIIAYGYFQELDENVSPSNVRGMDFYANDIRITRFNTSDQVLEISTPILKISESYYNFSFRQASWSGLPPMINAFEIYAVYDHKLTTTATEDVRLLAGIQRSFNLTDWTGDPCIPINFEWLTCTEDTSTPSANDVPESPQSSEWQITKLFLAEKSTMAALPPEIAGLTRLTDLNVSGIHLSEFPKNLSALKNLTVLNLSNNNLSGSVEHFINNIDFHSVQQLYGSFSD